MIQVLGRKCHRWRLLRHQGMACTRRKNYSQALETTAYFVHEDTSGHHSRNRTIMRQQSFFRGRHLITQAGRLIALLIKCMKSLPEAMQLFGGRLKLEVIKKRAHFQPHVQKAIAPHGWLCSSQISGVRFSWKLQHSACTNIVPSEQRKLSLNLGSETSPRVFS